MENLKAMEKAEDKFLVCASNHEDDTFYMEALMGEQSRELDNSEKDVDVDIMECVKSDSIGEFEDSNYDPTESSSSFGDTVSEHENGLSVNDIEADSGPFDSDDLMTAFGECGERGRGSYFSSKRKLTDHWKNFIHPIKWRCRWIELQLKELNNQELRYERELAHCVMRKQFDLERSTLEESGAKSLPFCSQDQRMKVMRRRKRKRIEDTIDITSHMPNHYLFSYFGKRKSFLDGTHMVDIGSKPVIPKDAIVNRNHELEADEEWSTLHRRIGDDSWEQVLSNIDAMQSQVKKLKQRVDKAVPEIPKQYSSINPSTFFAPCNALASPRVPVSPLQIKRENDVGDLIMPDDIILSHAKMTHVTDMNKTMEQPEIGGSYENTEDILMNNVEAGENLLDVEKVMIQPDLIENQARTDSSTQIIEVIIPSRPCAVHIDSTVQPYTTPIIEAFINKKKRGIRKSKSRWSKISSG